MFYASIRSILPEPESARVWVREVGGHPVLPDGRYVFDEWFCTNLECHCRRSLIRVYEMQQPDEILATITYGFASVEYYTRILGDRKLAAELTGASLEEFARQSPMAPALLALFTAQLEDPEYAARIESHYVMTRASTRTEERGGRSARIRRKRRRT
jgi:hypothetical protein